MLKKIVVIGPESTGKSTLCGQLAKHYNTIWCPEYAREYLLANGTEYTFDNLLTIAKGQLEIEEKYSAIIAEANERTVKVDDEQGKKMLFIDTDQYVMKVWCEFVFGGCHNWILNRIAERKYDLYLLCNIDLPWVEDELREYPDDQPRKELFAMYRDILINQKVPWVSISGDYEQRLKIAKHAVDTHLSGSVVSV